MPGFVDLQCNGGFGIDLASEPERLWELAALLPRSGVTAWLPTIVTGPPEVRARALAALRAGPPPALADVPLATPLGLHLEGPFLAPERRGAHDPAWLRPPPTLGPAPAGASVSASGPGLAPAASRTWRPATPTPAGPASSAWPRGRSRGCEDLASEVAGWSREAGVALVTLAPERPGALDLVRALAGRGSWCPPATARPRRRRRRRRSTPASAT